MFALTIVLFFLGIVAVICLHELGHYFVARRYGFKVEEYFVGFGPRLWSTRRGETEYGVKAIIVGGYVKIAGMNPYQPVPPEDLPRAYGSKPIWQRALVIFAGPGSHLLIAAVLFTLGFLFVGDPGKPVAQITAVVDLDGAASPAAQAGLQPGDRIVGLGDVAYPTADELSQMTVDHARSGTPLTYTIERDGSTFQKQITPILPTGGTQEIGRIGIVIDDAPGPTLGPLQAVGHGIGEVGTTMKLTLQEIPRIFGPAGISRVVSLVFTDAKHKPTDAVSALGLGRQVGEAGRVTGLAYVMTFALGAVALFIGLLNLLPLPPFDGGHLAMLAIEKIRGRAVDMRRMIPVAVAVMGFFVTFVTLAVIADIKDIAR
jgi:membrane-associated protease RseP (regulator of RpoE activity)